MSHVKYQGSESRNCSPWSYRHWTGTQGSGSSPRSMVPPPVFRQHIMSGQEGRKRYSKASNQGWKCQRTSVELDESLDWPEFCKFPWMIYILFHGQAYSCSVLVLLETPDFLLLVSHFLHGSQTGSPVRRPCPTFWGTLQKRWHKP